MIFLKRYGKLIAGAFIILGLLSLVSAFTLFSQTVRVSVWVAGALHRVNFTSTDIFPANWLLQAGIPIYPGDGILYKGLQILPNHKLVGENNYLIVYRPAFPVLVGLVGGEDRFFSSASSLGDALYENGYTINRGDSVSLPLNTPLNKPLTVEIIKAQPVVIELEDTEIETFSAGKSIAQVLTDAGITLQADDYAIPSLNDPLPIDRRIQVVRVREETRLEETSIPFGEERVADANLSIGEQKILQSGQNGTRSEKLRLRFENNIEKERVIEAEWISKPAVSQKIAYGTSVSVQPYQTPDGTIDSWLTQEVYITSYLDTGNPTASGIWPYYGTIAVPTAWYPILKGTSIYVPGYGIGTVLDVCPGCTGKPWIDVFIPTEEYVPWSRTEVIYFLPPAPENFPGALP